MLDQQALLKYSNVVKNANYLRDQAESTIRHRIRRSKWTSRVAVLAALTGGVLLSLPEKESRPVLAGELAAIAGGTLVSGAEEIAMRASCRRTLTAYTGQKYAFNRKGSLAKVADAKPSEPLTVKARQRVMSSASTANQVAYGAFAGLISMSLAGLTSGVVGELRQGETLSLHDLLNVNAPSNLSKTTPLALCMGGFARAHDQYISKFETSCLAELNRHSEDAAIIDNRLLEA